VCYIVHCIYSYCNVVYSYYTCYNIVQFIVPIGYYIAHCTLPSCAGARLLRQAESLCFTTRAFSCLAMLGHSKSLGCALIFNRGRLRHRRRRRPALVLHHCRPRGRQNRRCLRRSPAHHQQQQARDRRRWTCPCVSWMA